MRRPSIKFDSSLTPQPPWAGYCFAIAVSALAWAAESGLNTIFVESPVTPFLPGFAAVIASAAWAGFGPGLVSIAAVALWCGWSFQGQQQGALGGEVIGLAIFVAAGVLLCSGCRRLRRATREIARSEDWHRKLVEISVEGVCVTDTEGLITYANPRIAEILGTGTDAVTGKRLEEFFFPTDLSIERIRFQNRRAGSKEQFDRRLCRQDGTEVWVLTCSNPVFDSQKRFTGVLSMMTDITERKSAEHALRRSEERFRGLFENVLEGVYQSTPDGRIIAANPMLLRMLGLANEAELNDVNIANDLYVDPAVRKRLLERLESDGSFQNVEYELRRRDGHVISVQENARVVRDENGALLYYEGTLADISERKRIEEQLRQSQRMEALGRLAGGVAHDFSNILTIITGYAHLALEELPPYHPARSSAEETVKAAESASGLTQQLLSLSRRRIPSETVDLNAAVSRSEEALRRVIGKHGRLIVSVAAQPIPISAEPGHLEQILFNLAVNARLTMAAADALEVKTEVVTVEASVFRNCPGAYTGVYAALSVRHTNAGAVPFDYPENRNGGLATTKSLVSRYNGFLVVDSHPDGGPILTAYLPRAENAEIGENAETTGPRKRILLVDDEPLIRELSRDMLERQGFQVFVANDASDAERMCSEGDRFDLLITDIVMPRMSGRELARRLRTSRPDLKVLFISGYSDLRVDAEDSGKGEGFLRKPYTADSRATKSGRCLRSRNFELLSNVEPAPQSCCRQ